MAYNPYGFQYGSTRNKYTPFQTPPSARLSSSYNPLNYEDMQNDPYQLPAPTQNPVDLPIKFGQNINLQAPPQAPPSTNQPVDFMSEYAKLNSNRPNRLAYQQAVQEGAPEIQRGKWAQLGAMLAAGAAGMANPRDPQGSYSLGRSAFLEPQRRSDEAYEKKVRGLGTLAQFEESDKANEIKALEMKYNDWYRQQEELRNKSREEREVSGEKRATELSAVQIAHIKQQMAKENSKTWTDEMTGITYEQDENGKITFQKKTRLTPQEEADKAGLKKAAEGKADEPFQKAADERRAKSAREVAGIGADARRDVADKNAASKIAAITARLDREANKPSASEEYKRMMLNLKTAMVNEPYLADYIKQAPDGSFIPKDESDFYFPDDDDRANIKKVKAAMLAGAPAGAGKGGGAGGAGINPTTGKPKTNPLGINKG